VHPVFNEVSDNVIHHCGLYDTYAAGVFLGLSNWNRIIHNEIHDCHASDGIELFPDLCYYVTSKEIACT